MNKLFGITCLAPVALAGLALSGCGSKAQKEVDEQAKAIDKSYEAEADIKEAVAAGAPKAEQARAHNEAEALRNQGEDIKDNLQAEAKELKKVPNK